MSPTDSFFIQVNLSFFSRSSRVFFMEVFLLASQMVLEFIISFRSTKYFYIRSRWSFLYLVFKHMSILLKSYKVSVLGHVMGIMS